MAHIFQLDNRRGKQYKHTCPNCKAPHSFRRFINTQTGEEVAPECGKCDHINRCKYFLPPREYFKMHPDAKNEHKTNSPSTASHKSGQDLAKELAKPALYTLPYHYVSDFHSWQSHFTRWFYDVADKSGIPRERTNQLYTDYMLGADNQSRVIFWQIDRHQRVRSGKLMRYTADGHRTGYPNWMHCALGSQPDIDKSFQLTQCFFGEHLLARYPTLPVGVVESEKTALICSLFLPDTLWLATGGCKQLNTTKLVALQDRKLTLYPDSGVYAEWLRTLVCANMQNVDIDATMEAYPANTDLADILLDRV